MAHRRLFLLAALLWLCAQGVWLAQLSQPRPAQHALLMSLGFMPLFITGFALGALPRWLGVAGPAVAGWPRVLPVLLAGLAWQLLSLQGPWSQEGSALAMQDRLQGAALVLQALWLALLTCPLLRRLALAWPGSTPARRGPVRGLLLGLGLLLALQALAGLALWLAQPQWLPRLSALALWLALGMIFTQALARLSALLAPALLPWLWLALALRAAPLQTLEGWPAVALALVWLALAATLWRHGSRPELAAARRSSPFVAQLRRGLLWLTASLALAALALLWPAQRAALLLASTHAYALGGLLTLMLAMVSRVSAVHAGQALAADARQRGLHALLQALAGARVLACWPGAAALLPAVAAGMTTLAGLWLWRYAPLLRSPVAKDKP